MKRILITLAAAACLLAAVPHASAAPARPAQLSEQDRQDVARIEAHLNSIRTLSAKFLQLNQDGGIARGTFMLSRPGKMRFEYEAPSPILMVADGRFLIFHDASVRQTSHLPLNSTPVSLLVREQIRLSGDTTITSFERAANTIRVGVRQTKEPEQGQLTLVFNDNPLQLAQWSVLDAQNVTTRVTLIEPQLNVKVDPNKFYFVDPFALQRPAN